LINKTFKQLNAERALRRARPKKKIKQKNKASSSQAGGPAHKESGFKQLKLTSDKLIGYYKIHK